MASQYSQACEHLRRSDPAWKTIIDAVGDCRLEDRRRATNYESLVRILVGQQISVQAAASIYARVCAHYGGRPPTPPELLAASTDELRELGLSRPKATYLRDLAAAIEDDGLDPERLDEVGDETAIERLTAVRGIGIWTAEVFLVFQLGRPDVFPAGDLGLRRAVRDAWRLDDMPAEAELRLLAEPWRPWRSVASWYLWQSLRVAAPA